MTIDLEETGFPQTVQDVESVFLDDSVPNFRKALQKTRHHEIIKLTISAKFPYSFFSPIPAYGWYLWTTWTNVVCVAYASDIRFIDWYRLFSASLLTSIILWFLLLWCQFASLPPLQRIYWWWSEKFNGNVGLINLLTPQLFKGLLPAQIAAADDGLSLPEAIEPAGSTAPLVREFNLDVAKLLLQISAVVYERRSDAIYESVAKTHGGTFKRGKLDADFQHFREAIGSTFTKIDDATKSKLGWNKRRWGTNIIEDFCKRTGLSYAPISELNSSTSAFASFFWKGGGNWIVVAFKGTGPIDFPDYVTDLTSRLVHADEVLPKFKREDQLHKGFRDRIWPNNLVTDTEIQGRKKSWEQISSLIVKLAEDLVKHQPAGDKINVWFTGHSLGCALAGLAYTRAINNFAEDFGNAPIVIRDAYVFGSPVVGNRFTSQRFNQVIKGQKEIKTLWRVTNHDDLVATGYVPRLFLFFIGEHSVVSNCAAFTLTTWMFCSSGPQLGDNPNLPLTPTNPGGLAHIGAEIRMLDYDKPSHFAGTLYDANTIVRIWSKFTAEDLKEQRAQQLLQHPDWEKRVGWGNFVQQIPLLGRLFAHSAGLYWNQLAALAPIRCVWVQGWDPVDPFSKLYTESISG
ncbi:Alpha/Beta hydrolase protein [Cantharellus anzutake]|uniref:Alpha/Beta hydrolase protein n=1 Tax=Cantharellus anzutake TaxID=1750568 RepID=UPI001902E1F7|nr:Alpha/Beta hydrolase protein [Cantharellus anzutake]KAF8309375.1 Alpha/Beta hydrolase protein [Cantharellus anzutake]